MSDETIPTGIAHTKSIHASSSGTLTMLIVPPAPMFTTKPMTAPSTATLTNFSFSVSPAFASFDIHTPRAVPIAIKPASGPRTAPENSEITTAASDINDDRMGSTWTARPSSGLCPNTPEERLSQTTKLAPTTRNTSV